MSYITVDNLNVINAEMTNWCNASCPRCGRFTWKELTLRKDRVNSIHTSLELIKKAEKIKKKEEKDKFLAEEIKKLKKKDPWIVK